MNPCNCGYYPDRNRCRCTQASLQRYFDRISQPLIDRMDLCVEAPMVTYEELTGNGNNESSKTIRDRVCECQERQIFRFKDEIFSHNSGIPAAKLNQFCRLGEKEQRYMEKCFINCHLRRAPIIKSSGWHEQLPIHKRRKTSVSVI